MVTKPLCGGQFRCLVPLSFMTAATAATPPATAKVEGRSPFVRLHELLADYLQKWHG